MPKIRKSSFKVPGLNKALGITRGKRTIARITGIPTSKSGRRRKAKRLLTGGGCLIPFSSIFVIIVAVVFVIIS